jgi:hypothetical protein
MIPHPKNVSMAPSQTNASIADNIFQDHVRHLLEGKKKVIAIRVVGSSGAKLSSSPSQISDSIFGTNGDPHNLVSRYDECSFGKLRMEPVEALNSGDPSLDAVGVYEVKISASANNVDNPSIREKVTDQLNIDWPATRLPEDSPGRLDSSVPFDHAMYCLPPGTKGSWVRDCHALRAMERLRSTVCFTHFAPLHFLSQIAYAYTNSWLSVYNGIDLWIKMFFARSRALMIVAPCSPSAPRCSSVVRQVVRIHVCRCT